MRSPPLAARSVAGFLPGVNTPHCLCQVKVEMSIAFSRGEYPLRTAPLGSFGHRIELKSGRVLSEESNRPPERDLAPSSMAEARERAVELCVPGTALLRLQLLIISLPIGMAYGKTRGPQSPKHAAPNLKTGGLRPICLRTCAMLFTQPELDNVLDERRQPFG